MGPEFILMGAAAVAYVALLLVAMRNVAVDQSRWLWVEHSFRLLIPLAVIYGGWRTLATIPLLGLAMVGLGVAWLAVSIHLVNRVVRNASSTAPRDAGAAGTGPELDLVILAWLIVLIGGVIAVVALIVYGVMVAAR